jgi:hypothetical protein
LARSRISEHPCSRGDDRSWGRRGSDPTEHPRSRGDDSFSTARREPFRIACGGTPPLTRVRDYGLCLLRAVLRNTPAHAGTTQAISRRTGLVMQHPRDGLWIQPPSSDFGPQLAGGLVDVESVAVGPWFAHRLVGVGGAEDTGRSRDRTAGERTRVAGAVQSLPVLNGQDADRRQPPPNEQTFVRSGRGSYAPVPTRPARRVPACPKSSSKLPDARSRAPVQLGASFVPDRPPVRRHGRRLRPNRLPPGRDLWCRGT